LSRGTTAVLNAAVAGTVDARDWWRRVRDPDPRWHARVARPVPCLL